MKLRTATICALVASLALGTGTALAGANVEVERLAGATRYETAAAAATADAKPPEHRGAAMLARADAFPDGLTAANLGDVPLFLTESPD